MHRIDGPGATVDNKFTDGDPVGGIQPTVVTDEWMNDVQENIMAVLVAAGVSPTKGRAADLLDSLKKVPTGRLINIRLFTASGTYTPTSGTNSIVVEVCGGGGGGGGGSNSNTPSPGFASTGTGGSAGASAKGMFTSAFTGLPITVGAGGSGGISTGLGANGSNGGSSSLGGLISAGGGAGGPGGIVISSFPTASSEQSSVAVGVGGTIYNGAGAIGDKGTLYAANNLSTGKGASSAFGAGGYSKALAAGAGQQAGANATGFGAGGGGAGSVTGGNNTTGGNGASGFVIIWEYS
ncbi:hypothetical protein LOY55_10550 [Pseudomonas sp. B21-040]|uniref:glycine-rich domain-containing protein n=1 Tax=unclassified Pseudomonas TaxID=196821 RepID=UPI001CBF0B3E|nr:MULTISPECIES: hypothetical protein [unclassified Pseudomonas]UVL43672.1 hypothetical protein LOY55_10550 [Pseudomonas sp. B21-040]